MRSTAKGVTIQLDVPRKLRFDGEALLRLEEITGMTVMQVCNQFRPKEGEEALSEDERNVARAEKFSVRMICQITQAGLTDELPHASTKDIIKLMDENGKGEGSVTRVLSYLKDVFAAFSEAVGTDPKKAKADLAKMEAEMETAGRKEAK